MTTVDKGPFHMQWTSSAPYLNSHATTEGALLTSTTAWKKLQNPSQDWTHTVTRSKITTLSKKPEIPKYRTRNHDLKTQTVK